MLAVGAATLFVASMSNVLESHGKADRVAMHDASEVPRSTERRDLVKEADREEMMNAFAGRTSLRDLENAINIYDQLKRNQ